MKINYKLFTKHAEKVAKTASEARPILKGINHDNDGNLAVTDSHRLYTANNVNAPTNAVLDAVTGEEIDGNYPEVSRLIPEDSDAKASLTVTNVKQFKGVIKAMQNVAKADGFTKKDDQHVFFTGDYLQLHSNNNIIMSYEFDAKIEIQETTWLRLNYLLEAVEMLDDMQAQALTLRFYGRLRPMTIKPEASDDVMALILPIRKDNVSDISA